jgi:N-acetylglutamate synthase-like GNAT family acetyltransferase
MAIIKRSPNSRLGTKYRNKAYGLVSSILDDTNHFNQFLRNANRNYVILNNKKHFRGFATVTNWKNIVQVELIGTNTKRRPNTGKGWGSLLMNAIKNNAKKKGVTRVKVHDPVSGARGFYRKLGYNTASNTFGGTRTMKRRVSPPSPQSRLRLSPIKESPTKAKSSPRRSPQSPLSASARGSPSK